MSPKHPNVVQFPSRAKVPPTTPQERNLLAAFGLTPTRARLELLRAPHGAPGKERRDAIAKVIRGLIAESPFVTRKRK